MLIDTRVIEVTEKVADAAAEWVKRGNCDGEPDRYEALRLAVAERDAVVHQSCMAALAELSRITRRA